MLHIELVGFIW